MKDDADRDTPAAHTAPPDGRFVRRPDPDAATLADLRRRYDAGDLSAAGIAMELGLSPWTIRKRLAEWGWKRAADRSSRRPKKRRAGAKTLAADAGRLRKVVRDKASRMIRRLETKLDAPENEEDAERIARTLASLVKTLAEIKRLEASNGNADDDASETGAPSADLARIKTELVDRLVAAAATRGDEGDPSGP